MTVPSVPGPSGDWVLADVRPWGGAPADLVIRDGRIAEVRGHADASAGEADGASDGGVVVDGRGLLALPGLVNAHAHVDKSWWGRPWEPFGGEATTRGRIAHERAHRDRLGIPSAEVTARVLREFVRHGTTTVRSHVDVDLGVGLRGLEAVAEAVAALGGAVEVEVVAFPQDGVLRRPGVAALLREAVRHGASHVGGLDPAGIDRDPVGQLDEIFTIAEQAGAGVDVHLHDPRELGAFQIELIAERTVALGMQGRVNVAHGFALGELADPARGRLLERVVDAGLSWTTVAPVRSAPLPWRDLRERAGGLGLGTDGIRDLWQPYGDGDLLKVALTFARLHGLRHDDELTDAVRLATTDAARLVGRDLHDLTPGARADVVLVDAENVMDALVRTPRRELVVAGGRVVARQGSPVV